jgi:hypothetical protein
MSDIPPPSLNDSVPQTDAAVAFFKALAAPTASNATALLEQMRQLGAAKHQGAGALVALHDAAVAGAGTDRGAALALLEAVPPRGGRAMPEVRTPYAIALLVVSYFCGRVEHLATFLSTICYHL